MSAQVLLLREPLGADGALPVLDSFVHSLNVPLNFVIIGEGFVAFWTDIVVFTAFSFVSMDESDMSLQLLYSSVTDWTFFFVHFLLIEVNNVYVFLQISAGSELFITFITFMTLQGLVASKVLGQGMF